MTVIYLTGEKRIFGFYITSYYRLYEVIIIYSPSDAKTVVSNYGKNGEESTRKVKAKLIVTVKKIPRLVKVFIVSCIISVGSLYK
jgi:hypothetical protein